MIYTSNPILEGFYPDPSICAVEDDFYLVNSSFAYFPAVPIFHSKDLAHWQQIGNVLDRASQVPLEACRHSGGIYAPTIRYHKGLFYMITTNVTGGGNMIVTASKPEGPWSDPYYLDAPGIDPSLFFDDDDRCYYIGTRPNPEGTRYNGDWEIWIQEVDLQAMCLIGESHAVWKGALKDVIWPEGPHLYKKDGYYYIMIAEGGTGPNHSVTVARSRTLEGPYENNPNNPILTHRHLGKDYPIVYVGHGDLVQTQRGAWYMVVLASRPCEGYTNRGRETFLAKVTWEEGWPVVNAGVGKLEEVVAIDLEEVDVMPPDTTYHFYTDKLDPAFVMLRNPKEGMYALEEGCLRLFLDPATMKEEASPAYIGVRQQHMHYQVSTRVQTHMSHETDVAGLTIIQNNAYHVRFEVGKGQDDAQVVVLLCEDGKDRIVGKAICEVGAVELKVIQKGQKASFYYRGEGEWVLVAKEVPMATLSTEVAGGFTGCTIGMHTSSQEIGRASCRERVYVLV